MGLSRRFFVRSVVLAAAAVTLSAGCTDFSHTPESLGHLIVHANDENGAAVGGISFIAIRASDNTPWSVATTGASGTAEFREADGGILPQLYRVRFDDKTPGYTVAPGQQVQQNVQVVLGQTHDVTFVVRKTTPGGGPGS
jgi:hypothetical protein